MSTKSGKKKRAAAKAAAAKTAQPSQPDDAEFSSMAPVATLDTATVPVSEAAKTLHEQHHCAAKACVMRGVASGWRSSAEWSVANFQDLMLEAGPVNDPVDVVAYVNGSYKIQRLPNFMEYMEHLRQFGVSSTKPGKAASKDRKCGSLRGHGLSLPRKALEASCPTPEILKAAHQEGLVKLRDLSGRLVSRVYTSARGPFGLCHTSAFGHGVFYAQVKGSSTWLLYGSAELPIERKGPFYDAAAEDFNLEKTRSKYGGEIAVLQEGDILYVPPYAQYTVRHEEAWNVLVDFECMPDKVWAEAAKSPAGLADASQLLGGRSILCYSLPGAIPDPNLARQVQEGLLAATFAQDAALVQRVMVARNAKIEDGLRAALLCAAGASLGEYLLECAITSEAAMPGPREALEGLVMLALHQQVKGDGAMKELGINIAALQAAAWSTIGTAPKSADRSDAQEPRHYEALAKVAMQSALAMWAGPGAAAPSDEAQVWRLVESLASAFDDIAEALKSTGVLGTNAAATLVANASAFLSPSQPKEAPAPATPPATSSSSPSKEEETGPLESAEALAAAQPAEVTTRSEGQERAPKQAAAPEATNGIGHSPLPADDVSGSSSYYEYVPMAAAAVLGGVALAGLYYLRSSRA